MGAFKSIAYWAVVGFFGAICLSIVFVQAGKGGGKSGGDQAATIIKSGGGALSDVAGSLEGG